MSNPDTTTVTTCNVDMETEICCHGCTVEWKIYDFENQDMLFSKNIRPPGCDYSWQLGVAPTGSTMTVGFYQYAEEILKELPFYLVVDITLQNTSGDLFFNKMIEQPSFRVGPFYRMGRPTSNRSVPVPGSSTGEQFRLARDDVLVFKAVIVTRGCCVKNKEVSLVSEKD